MNASPLRHHRHRAASLALVLGFAGCVDDTVVAKRNDSTRQDGAAAAAEAEKIRACVEDFGAGLNVADAGPPVSFRAEVMPLLVTHCNAGGCHQGVSSGFPPGFGDACWFDPFTVICSVDGASLSDDMARTVHANLTAQSMTAPDLRRVEPGRTDRSFLLMKLSDCQDAFPLLTGCTRCGSEMPPHGALRDADRASFDRLARWVHMGAGFD